MKKIAVFIFSLFMAVNSAFPGDKETMKAGEAVQAAMLMNQIQYTVSNILQNKNKEVLNQEFDFIINQVDKSTLYNRTIKESYEDLLECITNLKLTENERAFVIEMNERERKQAYTKAFSSFGSVFNPGASPVQLVTSLAYAGVSAGLNIMSAKYEADNKLMEQLFKLDQKDLETIDEYRKNLFSSWTDVISKEKNNEYEISEAEMKDFVDALATKKGDDLIRILESKKEIFGTFPIFWYQLGAQYQLHSDNANAWACYDKYESLVKSYSYLKTDPYYICVAKNRIQLIKSNAEKKKLDVRNFSKTIESYLKIIERNMVPENASENRVFLAGVYFELGQNTTAKELLKLNLAREDFYSVSSDMLSLIEYQESISSGTPQAASLIAFCDEVKVQVDGKENIAVSIPRKYINSRPVQVRVNGNHEKVLVQERVDGDREVLIIDVFGAEYVSQLFIYIPEDNLNQGIGLIYDCAYFKKDANVEKLLSEVGLKPSDIEACVLQDLYARLQSFSYDAKKDPEYTDLVDMHNKQISKQTSKEQRSVFEKEEKEKLDFLKKNGRYLAIMEKVSEVTKKLYEKQYFRSKLSESGKGMFCYSLREARTRLPSNNFDTLYTFEKFGVTTKRRMQKYTDVSYTGK